MANFGLHDGPTDGGFAVYRRASIEACGPLHTTFYFPLGCVIKSHLNAIGQKGLLCTRIKVFHALGPAYASFFGMLDAEMVKYSALGVRKLSDMYVDERQRLPTQEQLAERVEQIRASLAHAP